MLRTLLIVLLLVPCCLRAQTDTLHVQLKLGNETFTAAHRFMVDGRDTLHIATLHMYVGTRADEAQQWRYHLLDLFKTDTLLVPANAQWLFGVDSVTQTSGVYGGALDPMHGMYWAWNSGFVHFKLEGELHRADRSTAPVEWHIGGYAGEHSAIRRIFLNERPVGENTLVIDLSAFAEFMLGGGHLRVMSPSRTSATAATLIAQHIRWWP